MQPAACATSASGVPGRDVDLVGVDRRIDCSVAEPERREVVRDDGGREDLRHVERRLPGQRALGARERPEVVRVVAPHDRGERRRSPCCTPRCASSQLPKRRCRSARKSAAASVSCWALMRWSSQRSIVQAVDLRRLRHELPEAHRARGRARDGLEAALDHGDPDEVLGQRLAAQRAADHVAPAPRVPVAGSRRWRPARIVAEELEVAHDALVPAHRQVGHLELREPRQILAALDGRRREWGRRGQARRVDVRRGVAGHHERQVAGPRGSLARARRAGRARRSASRSARSSGVSAPAEVSSDVGAPATLRRVPVSGAWARPSCLPGACGFARGSAARADPAVRASITAQPLAASRTGDIARTLACRPACGQIQYVAR